MAQMQPRGPNTAAIRRRNKAVVRRMLKAFNTGDVSAVDKLIAEDAVTLSPTPFPAAPGAERDRVKAQITLPRLSFPDQHFDEEELIAEGDMVFLPGG